MFSDLIRHEEKVFYAILNTKEGCFVLVNFGKKDAKKNPEFLFLDSFEEFEVAIPEDQMIA